MIRTPEEHLAYVKEHAPEYYEKYKEALEKTQVEEGPKWRRTNGQLIDIDGMNNWHLSGALNLVSKFAVEQVETQEPNSSKERKAALYEVALPPVFEHLRKEAQYRFLNLPKNPYKE